MRRAGPYVVKSRANGTLEVTPRWPDFPVYNDDDGGGPGLFSRMQLAHDLEAWLNAIYPTGTTPERLEGADG